MASKTHYVTSFKKQKTTDIVDNLKKYIQKTKFISVL